MQVKDSMRTVCFVIKVVFLSSFLLFLAACGGGNSSDNNNVTGTVQFVEPDLYGSEFDQYTGTASAAVLRSDNLDAFTSIVLSDSMSSVIGGSSNDFLSGRKTLARVSNDSLSKLSFCQTRAQAIDPIFPSNPFVQLPALN